MTIALINTVPTTAELQSYKIIAEVAASNPYWKKVGGGGAAESVVATILSVMLLARELGISPIQAISGGINNIQGKFEISARLMNQLIRRHGHKIAIKMCTDEICVIWSKRKDTGEEHEEKYTIQEAMRSGLVKDGSAWRKVPTDMLFARCISRMARRLYADCIGGCYIEGELQEAINNDPVKPEQLSDVTSLKNEIEVKPEAPIVLPLPDHINRDAVNLFLEETSKTSKAPIEQIKKKAAANIDGFISAFESWHAKKFLPQLSQDEPEEELEEVAQ